MPEQQSRGVTLIGLAAASGQSIQRGPTSGSRTAAAKVRQDAGADFQGQKPQEELTFYHVYQFTMALL